MYSKAVRLTNIILSTRFRKQKSCVVRCKAKVVLVFKTSLFNSGTAVIKRVNKNTLKSISCSLSLTYELLKYRGIVKYYGENRRWATYSDIQDKKYRRKLRLYSTDYSSANTNTAISTTLTDRLSKSRHHGTLLQSENNVFPYCQ